MSDRRWYGHPVHFKAFGFSNTASATNPLSIAVTGQKLVVLKALVVTDSATEISILDTNTAAPVYVEGSAAAGVPLAANGGFRDECEKGLAETNVGADIEIVTSAAAKIAGSITYAVVKQDGL